MLLLSTVQLGSAILLIVLVLLQRANTDASGAFGQDGGTNFSVEKRGVEKTMYRLTIATSVAFVLVALYPIFR